MQIFVVEMHEKKDQNEMHEIGKAIRSALLSLNVRATVTLAEDIEDPKDEVTRSGSNT